MFEAVEALKAEYGDLERQMADPELHSDQANARSVGDSPPQNSFSSSRRTSGTVSGISRGPPLRVASWGLLLSTGSPSAPRAGTGPE